MVYWDALLKVTKSMIDSIAFRWLVFFHRAQLNSAYVMNSTAFTVTRFPLKAAYVDDRHRDPRFPRLQQAVKIVKLVLRTFVLARLVPSKKDEKTRFHLLLRLLFSPSSRTTKSKRIRKRDFPRRRPCAIYLWFVTFAQLRWPKLLMKFNSLSHVGIARTFLLPQRRFLHEIVPGLEYSCPGVHVLRAFFGNKLAQLVRVKRDNALT